MARERERSRMARGAAAGRLVTVVGVAVVGVALFTGAKAIGQPQRPVLGPAVLTTAPSVPAGGPGGTPPPAAPSAGGDVTLAFGGDVNFETRVQKRLDAGAAGTFGPVATALSGADLAMVNLATSVTDRGSPERKQFFFRAPSTAFDALRGAGVDVASMANDHGVDFGRVGLEDSLAASGRSQLPVVGLGRDAAAAYTPFTATVRGHPVAILAASQTRDETLTNWTAGAGTPGIASAAAPELVAAVKAARQRAEIVVVYLNWGTQGQGCPQADQRTVVNQLAAAGADAVVGAGAGRLQGAGWAGQTYVDYGLGSFLWWDGDPHSDDTAVLTVTFHGRQAVRASLTPARLDGTGAPIPATGAGAAQITAALETARACSGLDRTPPS